MTPEEQNRINDKLERKIDDLTCNVYEIKEQIAGHTPVMDEILAQTKKTNGRVNELEVREEERKLKEAKIAGQFIVIKWCVGIIGSMVVFPFIAEVIKELVQKII